MIDKIYIWIGSLSAALLAIAAIFMRGKRAGKQQSGAKQNEAVIKSVAQSKQIKDDVAGANAIERKQLRKKWERD